ncbi:MAG: AtpZ/AtpI family protein [Devosiaceae bacterium]|nr:AtpZ/AtpI family protein [Devosiaceae bacterium MH13]
MAVRVSSDFIAAIFVGAVLGWGVDQIAGTEPLGFIVLLLLGFAAGVLNVMRTLGLVAQAPSAQARAAPPPAAVSSAGNEARRDDTEEKGREGR